jgi:hypothetical protein
MIRMNPSSANLVYNDLDICNGFTDSFINDLDIHQMYLDVSDHLDSKMKLWPKVGQITSTMNFSLHYEFSVILV